MKLNACTFCRNVIQSLCFNIACSVFDHLRLLQVQWLAISSYLYRILGHVSHIFQCLFGFHVLVYIHLRIQLHYTTLTMKQLELDLSLGISGRRKVRKINSWFVIEKKLRWKFQWFIYKVQNNLINTLNKLTYVCYSLLLCKLVPDVFCKCRWFPLLLTHSGYNSAQLKPLWLVDRDVLYLDKPL